jgi:uncharacterized protein YwgA
MKLDALVSYVVESYGPIRGKKAFQKIFYFLTMAKIPTGLNYTLYHYGPYSSELDYKTDQIQLTGAIELVSIGMGYEIREGGQASELSKDPSLDQYREGIHKILDILPLDNPLKLELYSTTHYAAKVRKEIYDCLEEEDIVNEVIRIKKDKFSKEEIREAYKFILEKLLV